MRKTIKAIISDCNNYEARKVDRTKINGLIISTAFSSDCGYETAVIDAVAVYPVERYQSREDAIEGHKKWCQSSKELRKVVMLGDADEFFEPKEVTLIKIT